MNATLKKVISGGQTGVDRAALDAARAQGIKTGGWCPAGRRAEDGWIPDPYSLQETPTDDYIERTEWNVRDSDATLVLSRDRPERGTRSTVDFVHRYDKPVLVIDPLDEDAELRIAEWLSRCEAQVLNVAGPRQTESPGIYSIALSLLNNLFARIGAGTDSSN